MIKHKDYHDEKKLTPMDVEHVGTPLCDPVSRMHGATMLPRTLARLHKGLRRHL